MEDFKKVIKYFSPILKINKLIAIFPILLFGLGDVLIHIISPIFYKNIIDVATQQVATGIYNFHQIIIVFWKISFLLIFGYLLYRLGSYVYSTLMDKASKEIDMMSFEKIQEKNYLFFVNNFTGSLTNKLKRIASNFRSIYDTLVFSFILLSMEIFLTFFVLFRENFYLGLVFFIFIVLFIVFSLFFMKKQSSLAKKRAIYASKATGVLSDIISNSFNIKIFSADLFERNFYKKTIEKLSFFRLKSWRYQDKVRVYKSIFFSFFEITIIGLSIYLFTQQKISLGVFILVLSYLKNIIGNIWHLDKSLTRLIEVFSDTVDAIDIFYSPLVDKKIVNIEKNKIKNGEILFKDVSFTYPEGDQVFKKFNLKIPAGQSVGLIGKSGSGKSTLTKLLLRFYDVNEGEIIVDGQNIDNLARDNFRLSISYIPQETVLFHRTIYENISYGKISATEKEVKNAARSAYVDEFVRDLPDGYTTKVGERGVKLSGGQRQRIGVARAMLRENSPILILDEATSSLDSISESYIQDSFEKLSKNRTTIVIAHRLSTIQKMDRIIVLDNGKIIEDGSHKKLLEKKGHYAKLWNAQVDGFIS